MEKEIINKLIQNRKSIYPRFFIEKKIDKTILEQMMKNADRAPTHKLTQPWRFVVLQKQKKMDLAKFFAKKYKETTATEKFRNDKFESYDKKAKQSDCIILINMQRDENESIPEWEEICSTAMAVQNIYLTCTAYKIGCYWSSPKLIEYLPEFLPYHKNEKCLGLLYLGYYEKELPLSKRSDLSEKVRWFV